MFWQFSAIWHSIGYIKYIFEYYGFSTSIGGLDVMMYYDVTFWDFHSDHATGPQQLLQITFKKTDVFLGDSFPHYNQIYQVQTL